MAEILDLFLTSPATWGFMGAWIYAAPRWLACAVPVRGIPWRCSAEAAISLAVGAIAAAAFAHWVLAFFHQGAVDLPAVAAMIGLLANPVAPKLIDGFSNIATNAISGRFAKLIKGDDK